MQYDELKQTIEQCTTDRTAYHAILTAVEAYTEARIADSQCSTLRELLAQKQIEFQKHYAENLKDPIEAMEVVRDRDAIIRVLSLMGVQVPVA